MASRMRSATLTTASTLAALGWNPFFDSIEAAFTCKSVISSQKLSLITFILPKEALQPPAHAFLGTVISVLSCMDLSFPSRITKYLQDDDHPMS